LGSDGLPRLTTDWVLGQFGRETKTARRRYRRFVHDGIGLGHEPRFHAGSATDGRVIGEDRFVERILSREHPKSLTAPTVDAIVAAVTSRYGLSETEMGVRGNTRTASQARALVGLVAVHTGADTLTAIGRRFNRDVATLSAGVKRLRMKIKDAGSGDEPWQPVLHRFDITL
jgi:hypothetical protein